MKGQEIKAEERDAIFGESPLGYVIFEETSYGAQNETYIED